jgi:hypothetical protein
MICLTVPDNLFLKATNKTRILTDAFAAQQTPPPEGSRLGLQPPTSRYSKAHESIDDISAKVDALAGLFRRASTGFGC